MSFDSPLLAEHKSSGARIDEYLGCRLPEHFADLSTEYRAARESVALIDKGYRAFFDFTGPDRVRYLNAILTGPVRDLEDFCGAPSLLLTPQGHIVAELEVYALPEKLLVVSYAMIRERLAALLEKYIIMDDVTLADETHRYACVALEGPRTSVAVQKLTGVDVAALPELGVAEINWGGMAGKLIRRSPGGVAGVEFIAERKDVAEVWRSLQKAAEDAGGGPIGYATLNTLRLEAGIPWFGYDFDETVIPHEAGLENSHISYTKGCYTGQEIVERVRSRGHVNRKRVGLKFEGGTPETGESLLAGEHQVGRVTRAGFSPVVGAPIGMGYLRREHYAVGSRVRWSGGEAEVIALPVVPAASGGSAPS
jgi:folate-binding protein YgfZ